MVRLEATTDGVVLNELMMDGEKTVRTYHHSLTSDVPVLFERHLIRYAYKQRGIELSDISALLKNEEEKETWNEILLRAESDDTMKTSTAEDGNSSLEPKYD